MKSVSVFLLVVCLSVLPQLGAKGNDLEPSGRNASSVAPRQQQAQPDKGSPAIRQLRAKLVANPGDNLARLQLTQLLFAEGSYADAAAEGEKALSTFRDRASLYYQVGESYRQLKKYKEALQYLEQGYTIAKIPFADLTAAYGLVLVHAGRTQEASAILRKAAQLDPGFISKTIADGEKGLKENDTEDATDDFLAVLLLDRTKLTPEQVLFVQFNHDFKAFVESKDPAAATSSFVDNVKKKFGGSLDYDELASLFTCLVTTKETGQARNLYNETILLKKETVNQDTLDREFLGLAYGCSNACPELAVKIRIAFIRTVKSLYGLNEEDARAIYALHEFVLKQGLVNAASEITAALVNEPVLPRNRYVRLADAFLRYKKNDDAVATFGFMLKKKSLDKSGYSGDLTRIYSDFLKDQKNDAAQALMKEINELDETNVNATYAKLAEIFTREGQAEKSIGILQKLIQTDPTNVGLSVKLGEAFFAKERYDDVIASFANVRTKEGKRFLANAYERKYMLAEANRTWEELRTMTNDPKETAEAKKHIDDNLIAMMNPDFARLKAEANKPKAAPEKFRIVIDSPADGFQTATTSVEVTGRFLGAVTLQDVRVNGKSVGTSRGMKAVESAGQPSSAQDAAKNGLPFTYIVSLVQGKNEISLDAVAANGDSAQTKITVTMGSAPVKPMTIEEADGIRQTKAYAVIIGVARYQDAGIKSLNYTVNDADELANALTDPSYGGFKKENVTVLVNENATTKNIKKAIGVDLKRAPDDGVAVVFFAGHGAPEGEKTYWLTYDTDPTSLYASALSNDEVVDMLNRINTRRVVTFIDACYSGASITTTKSTRAVLIEDPFKAFEGSGRIAITSSDGREQSLEDPKLKHGIFTYRLIEAIKGKADYNGDGIVMADEIARYVKETVPNDARERSHKQDPVVVANYSGYIPLSRNPENVLKNSKIMQVQVFTNLYRDGKIDGSTLKKIREIIEGDDERAKKPIRDYLNKVFTLSDLLDIIGH
ncbi:MAG TPA: caspase family protein [Bacteroidota bacterium]|nr:caspase family protein [Bacteroidota bacterium]